MSPLPRPVRFDLNSGAVRRKFAYVFNRESPNGNPDDIATPSISLTGSSTRATAGASSSRGGGDGPHSKAARRKGTTVERNVTGCRRALFALDPKNADGRLFMILQLSKVLQGEPEKVRCNAVYRGAVRWAWRVGVGSWNGTPERESGLGRGKGG